jgi:hypothetical protein
VCVPLDRKATPISLLVVIGVREDGQKILLAVRDIGGEKTQLWRTVLDLRPRSAPAGVPDGRWRTRTGEGDHRRVERRAPSIVHGS